jgi:hypothetical protein
VIATQIGLFAKLLEQANLLLQQTPKRVDRIDIESLRHIRQRTQQRSPRFQKRIARGVDRL